MEFEIVDKRGLKKAAEAAAETQADFSVRGELIPAADNVTEFPKTVVGEVQQFKSIGYTIVYLMLGPNQQAMAGRAVGLRTDEALFTADWLMPPVWDEDLNWQQEAKKRLLTFKGCSCRSGNPCGFHTRKCPGRTGPGEWMVEDIERLRKVSATPLCEALEILMRAEAARQNAKIVAPGG